MYMKHVVDYFFRLLMVIKLDTFHKVLSILMFGIWFVQ